MGLEHRNLTAEIIKRRVRSESQAREWFITHISPLPTELLYSSQKQLKNQEKKYLFLT